MSDIDDENTSLEKVEESNAWLIFFVILAIAIAGVYAFNYYKPFSIFSDAKENEVKHDEHKICRIVQENGSYVERMCVLVGDYAYIDDNWKVK